MDERPLREEGGVRDGLGVGRNFIVLLVREIDVMRLEGGKDALDHAELLVWSAMLDEDLMETIGREIRDLVQ